MLTANGDYVLPGQEIAIGDKTYRLLHSQDGQSIIQCQKNSCLFLLRELEPTGVQSGRKHQITKLKPSINVHVADPVRMSS